MVVRRNLEISAEMQRQLDQLRTQTASQANSQTKILQKALSIWEAATHYGPIKPRYA